IQRICNLWPPTSTSCPRGGIVSGLVACASRVVAAATRAKPMRASDTCNPGFVCQFFIVDLSLRSVYEWSARGRSSAPLPHNRGPQDALVGPGFALQDALLVRCPG